MNFGKKTRVLAAAAALLASGTMLAVTDAVARTNHAVLIAVTKYPNVEGADLIGPNNDAQLVRDFLTTNAPVPFEAENVTLLADDVDGAKASPTHKAITDALAAVAAKAEEGDFVYLHMSGHGIQQPAADVKAEPDGLDEAFLPADIGPWVDRSRGIPSALADDEIGEAIQAIRDKGAFVWVVIDACHSGTATRALTGDVTDRKIEPWQLGIPDAAFAEALAEAGEASRSVEPQESRALALYAEQTTEPGQTGANSIAPGGMVAFFAAQTVETTPEMPLPAGDTNAKKLGLFTYTLFEAIANNPAQSYRQLGQSIMQAYAAGNRSRPTPLFEGNLDAPIFGTEETPPVRQWKVTLGDDGMSIPAGTLHQLAEGAKLALVASPADPDDKVVGFVEVREPDTLTSRIRTVEHEGKAKLSRAGIPDNVYARMTEVTFDTGLLVARPPASDSHDEEVAQTNALLEAIAGSNDIPVKIKLVDAGADANIQIAVLSEDEVAELVAAAGPGAVSATLDTGTRSLDSDKPRLWFLPPTAEISLAEGFRPPSIGFSGSTPDGLQAEVADSLMRISRATNLARLAESNNFDPGDFDVGFKVKRFGADETELLEAGTMPAVHPKDRVHIQAHNRSGRAVDINVLYVGSDYSIGHMYAERLHTGSKIDLPLLEFNASSYGVERMIVVLTEGAANTVVENLKFLESEGVRNMTRSIGHPEGFSGLLRDIASAPAKPATRAASTLVEEPSARGAVLIYPLENLPGG